MNDLVNGLLSCVFITIPETMFMVLLLIRICGRKDLLDVYRIKENIKSYIILIIPVSILMDVMNYGLKIKPRGVSVLTCLLVLYILTVYIFRKTEIEETKYLQFKVFMSLIPIYFILIMIDISNAFVWFNFLHLTFATISKNIYLVLLCSLSTRVIEFMILIFILVSKNGKFHVNIFNYIYNNSFFKKYVSTTMVLLLIFEIYIVKLILYNDILNTLTTLTEQILFVVCFTYLIPFFILTGVYIIIKFCIALIYDEKQSQNI